MSLAERSKTIELLERYSLFLEKQGYLDTDWRSEEPFAIDEFLKQEKIEQQPDKEKAAHYAGWYNGLVNGYKHDFSWAEYLKSKNGSD